MTPFRAPSGWYWVQLADGSLLKSKRTGKLVCLRNRHAAAKHIERLAAQKAAP